MGMRIGGMSAQEEMHVRVVSLKSHRPPDLDSTDMTGEHRVRQYSAPARNRIWAIVAPPYKRPLVLYTDFGKNVGWYF
jgi:hypothetical protein